jgi:hypothetical protein
MFTALKSQPIYSGGTIVQMFLYIIVRMVVNKVIVLLVYSNFAI